MSLLISNALEIFSQSIWHEKEKKEITTGNEEVKPFILEAEWSYIEENQRHLTKILMKITNDFSKVVEYMINPQKCLHFSVPQTRIKTPQNNN